MPALIGMSNAAWKRQPQGRVHLAPEFLARGGKAWVGPELLYDSGGDGVYGLYQRSTNIKQIRADLISGPSVSLPVGLASGIVINSPFDAIDGTESLSGFFTVRSESDGSFSRTILASAIDGEGRGFLKSGFEPHRYSCGAANANQGFDNLPLTSGPATYLMTIGENYGRINTSDTGVHSGIIQNGISIGCHGVPSTNRQSILACFYVLALKNGLREGEHDAINKHPWQIFAPAPSRFYLIPTSPVPVGPTTPTGLITSNITANSFRAGWTP